MKHRLERWYGFDHLHFITCSCYRRKPFLGTASARDVFLKVLSDVRHRYDFFLWGFVVMPEHIHLLITEPARGTPSTVLQALKQRASRALRHRRRKKASGSQMRLWAETHGTSERRFWQPRFYDFNVWTVRKKNEKINYMHFNPVKRGLVKDPQQWPWSSHCFYAGKGAHLCIPNPGWKPKPKNGKTRTLPNQRDAAPSLLLRA
jgi:putative transposase